MGPVRILHLVTRSGRGETGIVIDGLDPEEPAARMVELLRDPHLRVRLGERARRRAVRRSSTGAAGTCAARLADVVAER
ncbi:MAG: hypothetical protein QOG50_348 [Actinomycetota bacterium]|nr:hypothetical protein [Actinomycetota bacterium]